MPFINLKKHLERGEVGQSLVEMTVGFIVLIVIVSGLLDLGRAYFTFVALEDGAGEAALYGSIFPTCLVPGDCTAPNNAESRARGSGGEFVDWSSLNDDITGPGDSGIVIVCTDLGGDPLVCDLGDQIDATIAYPFELLTPIIPSIAGSNTLILTVHASQNVIGE